MTTKQIFSILVNDIHTTVIATTDKNGLPITCAVDIMDHDENGLYFLTAKGKNFYERLKKDEFIALTGIKGNTTMSSVAVSLRAKVKEVGEGFLPRLFEKNKYMNEIYPFEESKKALTVFYIHEGTGELFDLSKKPIERYSFAFGCQEEAFRYIITEHCIGCGTCQSVCPQMCITKGTPFTIKQNNCLHCGACFERCPVQAVKNYE